MPGYVRKAGDSTSPRTRGSLPRHAVFDAASFIAGLPHLPGVYRMLNAAGDVLYVGKARDLKKRVSSYFQKSDHGPRTQVMLAQVGAVEVTVARSEAEALLLEDNLIKSLAPRYNILFRDDKSYPYLMITGHAFRGSASIGARSTGKHAYLRAVPECRRGAREHPDCCRRCSACGPARTRCSATGPAPACCTRSGAARRRASGSSTRRGTMPDVRNARLFLDGREDDVMTALAARMQAAADGRDYEQAAVYRDQIRSLLESRRAGSTSTPRRRSTRTWSRVRSIRASRASTW